MRSTRATSLLLVLLAACVTLGWELRGLSSFTVPVFMWSDKQIFAKTQVLDTITTGDVEYALASLLHITTNKFSKLSSSFSEDTSTELVILFVEPELRTDQVPYIASAYSSTPGGSFAHLKKAMDTAESSLSMPYATVDEVTLFDSTLLTLFSGIDGKIFMSAVDGSTLFSRLRQEDGVQLVSLDSLMATLSAANVFSNHRTDLVIVAFDRLQHFDAQHFDAHDSIIGSLTEKISAKGNYVAMYAANMPVASKLIWTFEEHSRAEFQRNVDLYMFDAFAANNSTNPNTSNTTTTKINYFPGPFIEVLLVCAILITMLFTGACAIFSLQTPDKWEAPKAKREL